MKLVNFLERGESHLSQVPAIDGIGFWSWGLRDQRLELTGGLLQSLLGDVDPRAEEPSRWTERVHPEDLPGLQVFWRNLLAYPDRGDDAEVRIRLPDGSWRWLGLRGAGLRDEAGEVLRLHGSCVDLTERRQTESELRRANASLRVTADVTRMLLRTEGETELVTQLCRVVAASGGYAKAWVGFVDSARVVCRSGQSGFVSDEWDGLSGGSDAASWDVDPVADALSSGQPCVAGVSSAEAGRVRWLAPVLGDGCQAMLVLPLVADERSLGVLCLYASDEDAFAASEIQALQTLADDIAYRLIDLRQQEAREGAVEALKRNERKLADAERVAHVGYFERDEETNRLTWSDETYRIFGLKPQERPMTFAELGRLIHPDDREAVTGRIEEAMRRAARCEVYYRVIRPDGDVRVVFTQGDIIRDETGRARRVVGTVQDVTDQKRAEAALRRQDRMNHAMFSQATTCFLLIDRGYRIVQANEAYARHYGKPAVSLIGRGFFDVVSRYMPTEEETRALFEEVIRTRQPHVSVDRPYLFPDQPARGVTYWDSILQPILDERGDVEFLFLSAIDVTERHRAEEEARRQTRELHRVMTSVSDYLWSAEVDAHGNWTYGYYSPVVEKITGRPPEFYLRDPSRWLSTLHPDDRQRMQQVFTSLLARQPMPNESEYRIVLPDGRVRWVRDSWTITHNDGGGFRINGVVSDVTGRKDTEAKLRSLLDHFPDFVARYDREGRHVYVNPAILRELGFSKAHFLRRSPVEVGMTGHAASDATLLAGIQRALDDGEAATLEIEWTTPRGERHFEVRLLPETDENGGTASILAISRDVTKQKQAENGLQSVLRHARTIVMGYVIEAPQGWERHDVEWAAANFRWKAVRYDEAAAQQVLPVEVPPGGNYMHGWGRAKHADDQPRMGLTAHRALLAGASHWNQQFRCIDRHGRLHWFTQSASIESASHGRWRVTTINTDITERKLAEEALHAREEEFRALAENSPDIICRYDRDARLVYGNPTFERLWGEPLEKMLGNKPLDTISAHAGLRAYYEKMQQVLETGVPAEHEMLLDFLPNKPAPVHHIRLVPERDHGGGINSVLGIGRDVTPIKESEKKLRASEERFATVFHTSPTAICIVRAADDRFVDVNQAFVDAIGCTREQIIGHTAVELNFWGNPEDRQTWMTALREQGAVEAFKFRGRTTKGEPIVGLGATTYITLNGELHYLSLIHDITELEKAEDALRESEQRFRQVTENIDEVFWLTDVSKGRMIYISPAYERVWGRSCDSLYSDPLSWIDSIHSEDRERVRVAALTLQASGGYDVEYRVMRPDGGERWIHDRAFPIRDAQGGVYRIAGVAEDVTVRRQLEEQFRQSQKMEAIGQLAGGIAHDFNNLLVVMQVQSSLMLEDTSDPRSREGLQQIMDAAERAANLTRQLLTFSRRDMQQASDIDLMGVIDAMTKLLRRVLGEDIVFETRFASELPLVNADPGMMEQVLMNLAVNARDAMPAGGKLTIALDAEEIEPGRPAAQAQAAEGGRFVCLSVSDTGCGIPADNLVHIFEPFFTTKDVGRGTGLGLATVFGIVQQHRGWIEVDSVVDRGTCFKVYLPARSTAELQDGEVYATQVIRGGCESILLVEDDPSVRQLSRTVLERQGYRVYEADSAASALAMWQAGGAPVDLVMTDLVMPGGMTGRELAEELAMRDPRLKIMYTSGYSDEIVNRTLQLDAGRNFLQKPFAASELATAVRRCLDEC